MGQHRLVLVDVSEASREVIVRRLGAQGYSVDATGDPVAGADLSLFSPPTAVIADLWMPSISGVQLCRLLRTEPATAEVPVILRGDNDDPRSRFWAERAGAFAYVRKGRTGELMRALSRAVKQARSSDGFFMQLGGGDTDIRDRIAHYLDTALFESVVASEVRALGASGSFERLFDLLAQFLPQVIRYRWLAVKASPGGFALHHHPKSQQAAEREARVALGGDATDAVTHLVDEDPCADLEGPAPIVHAIPFAGVDLGAIAVALRASSEASTQRLVQLVSQELGGPLRMALLMEEQQRLAAMDPLTGLRNRRSFQELANVEVERARRYDLPLCAVLMDVDHFKSVNDTHGHAAGDLVLSSLGKLLRQQLRTPDVAARWGGEEFVLLLTSTNMDGALTVAERLRAAVVELKPRYEETVMSVSISLGVAEFQPGEDLDALLNRADAGMYRAKVFGRNRVVNADRPDPSESTDENVNAGDPGTSRPNQTAIANEKSGHAAPRDGQGSQPCRSGEALQ